MRMLCMPRSVPLFLSLGHREEFVLSAGTQLSLCPFIVVCCMQSPCRASSAGYVLIELGHGASTVAPRVKLPPEVPTSCVPVRSQVPLLLSWSPVRVPGSVGGARPGSWPLPPLEESCVEFLAPGFGLAQPWFS